jgi:hypothetical protein
MAKLPPVAIHKAIICLMKNTMNFIHRIPFVKLLFILVMIGTIQFIIINFKVWMPHPTDQSLSEFIIGRWIAIDGETTDIIGIPNEIDFMDRNDVYFEIEFPELYESMERNYTLNQNNVILSPQSRFLLDWKISRAGEELKINVVFLL